MKALKRASVGGNVQIDVTGTGEIVFGVISKIDGSKITMAPADGTAEIIAERSEFFKATAAEVKKAHIAATTPDESDEESDEDEDEGEASRSIVPPKYREKYTKDMLPTGRQTLNNNDETAQALSGMTLEEVKKFASKKMSVTAISFTKKWGHLNRGQQRMLIGNAYRAYLKQA